MHKVGYASTFQTVLSSFMLTFSTNICTMFGLYAIFVSPEFPWLFDLSLITSFQNRSFLDLRFTNWSTANNVAGQDSLARRLWSDWVNLPPPTTSPTPYVQGTTSVITWLRKNKRFVTVNIATMCVCSFWLSTTYMFKTHEPNLTKNFKIFVKFIIFVDSGLPGNLCNLYSIIVLRKM